MNVVSILSGVFQKVYDTLGGVMNIAAVTIVALALFTLLFGRDQRSASGSWTWIKNIVIAFAIFNCLGLFVTFGQDLFTGLGYQGTGGKLPEHGSNIPQIK